MIEKCWRPAFAAAVTMLAAERAGAEAIIHRVNCGGPAVLVDGGPPFAADVAYSIHAPFGYVGGAPSAIALPLGPLGNPYEALYRDAREGAAAYRFDLANGPYLVRLFLAETGLAVHGPDQRVFDVAVEGAPALDDVDLAERLGLHIGGEVVLPTAVTDGRLDVEFAASAGGAIVAAIEVRSFAADAVPPGPVPMLAAEDGYERVLLAFERAPDADVAGYRLERGPDPAGPFQAIATTWAAPALYRDATAPLGATSWYRIAALDAFGNLGPFSAAVSARARPRAESPHPVYELEVAPADLLLLNEKVLLDPDFEVPAVFRAGAEVRSVLVRYRGGNSRRYPKKSWKVKFAESEPFQGRVDLNLKAYYADLSLSREPLARALFAAVQHPASEQQRVNLFINGRHRGLFNEVEQVDERYLADRDRAPGGILWKCEANFTPLADPALYEVLYEQKTEEQLGNADLLLWIQFLASAGAGFAQQLADRFDVDDYLDYLAVVGFLGDADTVLHNYYLLRDPALERFELVTWDNDLAFGLGKFATVPKTDWAIDFGAFGSPDGAGSIVGFNQLKTRVLDVPALRWRYCEKLRALLAAAAAASALQPAVAAELDSIDFDARADVEKWGFDSPAVFEPSAPVLQSYAAPRAAYLEAALATYQPSAPPTMLWINELVADGVASLLDESAEPCDWIELYNAGGAPFDASGHYVTAELSQPLAYRIPVGTVIPAGGRFVVIADGEPLEGVLHAPFALDPAGGEVGLYAPDGHTLLDFATYRPTQLPDVAWGRLADGGAFFGPLPLPTPGTPNTAAGNLPPAITGVAATPSLPFPADPVTISAKVQDASGLAAVELEWRPAGGAFAVLAMAPAGGGRYEAALPPHPAGTVVEYYLRAVDAAGAAATKPSAAPALLLSYAVAPPPASALRINEFLADNRSIADPAGEFDDWLEIVNAGAAAIDLGGMFLTDDFGNPQKWPLPAGTVLAPGGHLLVWADEDPQQGPLHANFKLSKSGEELGLFASVADGNGLNDGFAFGPQATDVSSGRLPDGAPERFSLLDPSPGGPNGGAPGGAVRYEADDPGVNVVELAATGTIAVGHSFAFGAGTGLANSAGALLAGAAPLESALPFGALLVAPALVLPFAFDGSGQATLPTSLPAEPALAGAAFYAQAFAAGKGLSNGVAAVIGG